MRQIEPQLVASLRKQVVEDNGIQYMFEEVERHVDSFDARADKPPLTLLHDRDYQEINIDAEVAVPLKFDILQVKNQSKWSWKFKRFPKKSADPCRK